MSKRIVFDLDDTICYPNHDEKETFEKYGLAKPNKRLIHHMRDLYDDGWFIIIHSSRRMVTHDGDIDKIIKDVGVITEEWLDEHGVPYDDLIFGKPYSSSYYVDDKAMNVRDFYKWAGE